MIKKGCWFLGSDNENTLKKKILKKEHKLYIKVLKYLERLMGKFDGKSHEEFFAKFIKSHYLVLCSLNNTFIFTLVLFNILIDKYFFC